MLERRLADCLRQRLYGVALIVLCAPAWAEPAYRVFVTNELGGTLSVIDPGAVKVTHTLTLGKRPRGLQPSPNGQHVFVALSGSPLSPPGVDPSTLPPADKTADGIGVIALSSLRVTDVIRGVSDPEQLAVAKDGKHVYVASEDTGQAVILRVDTGERVAAIDVGGEPEGVAIHPDGSVVYMSSEEDHRVSVIATEGMRLIRQLPVGKRPRAIAFSNDGTRAYVTGENDRSVTVIDARQHQVLTTLRLQQADAKPMEVRVSPDGKRLYVATGRGGTVVALDSRSGKTLASVRVGARPWGLALSPDGKTLFSANGPSNDVSMIDAQSFRELARIPVGERPWGVLALPLEAP